MRSLAEHQPGLKLKLYNYRPGPIKFQPAPQVEEVQPRNYSGFLANLWRQRFIWKQAEREGADIYHGLAQELPRGIGKSRLKTVITVHDLIFIRFPKLYKPIDRRIYKLKLKHACQHADVIVAVSRQTRQDLVELLGVDPQKILVIHQGCAPVFWQNHRESYAALTKKYALPERFALFVGTLEPRKNPHRLLKKCLELKIPIILVGRVTKFWRDFRASLPPEGQEWRVLKVDSNLELAALYQMAAMFCYPSVFEGFGIPVLEAMVSGTPVITGHNSALPEVAGPGGFLIDVDSDEELGGALQKLWQDESLQRQLQKEARVYAQQFADRTLVAQWMDCYQNMLGQ